jgi:hypothetical protein
MQSDESLRDELLGIDKNEDKLFTFLEYDDVPWNNNNAEHAVRAFTRLRNVMDHQYAKGHARILHTFISAADLAVSG